mmetsp:Transcript_39447/g.112633  ORF Transcript_39447/g.112633 Transcript_39447/m.112633 type:complete len:200 (-) Transcript_39447:385-984(-)
MVLVLRVVLLLLARAHLVPQDLDLVFEARERALRVEVLQADGHELPVSLLDRLLQLLGLVGQVPVKLFPLLHLVLLLALPAQVEGILLAELLQLPVARLHAAHGLLPLGDELLAVLMQLLEELGRLVHLDLPRLGLCDLVREVLALPVVLHRQLLERQRQLPDLRVVRAAVLLERELVLLLLPGRYGPLLQLLLVPVHL